MKKTRVLAIIALISVHFTNKIYAQFYDDGSYKVYFYENDKSDRYDWGCSDGVTFFYFNGTTGKVGENCKRAYTIWDLEKDVRYYSKWAAGSVRQYDDDEKLTYYSSDGHSTTYRSYVYYSYTGYSAYHYYTFTNDFKKLIIKSGNNTYTLYRINDEELFPFSTQDIKSGVMYE